MRVMEHKRGVRERLGSVMEELGMVRKVREDKGGLGF